MAVSAPYRLLLGVNFGGIVVSMARMGAVVISSIVCRIGIIELLFPSNDLRFTRFMPFNAPIKLINSMRKPGHCDFSITEQEHASAQDVRLRQGPRIFFRCVLLLLLFCVW
jgi:hypothetical protein